MPEDTNLMPHSPMNHDGQFLRIGHGYDLHRLEPIAPVGPGRPLVIGGIAFEHDRGPVGHSDGDVLLHAMTDALLGALALPDIGQLFPNTDPVNEGRDSADFLREALRRTTERGYQAVNLDATVILERPKLGDRKAEIRSHIAALMGLNIVQVNIKGKTHEGVDAIGEGRAIEAHVVVLLERIGT